jgi:hypothetical protein
MGDPNTSRAPATSDLPLTWCGVGWEGSKRRFSYCRWWLCSLSALLSLDLKTEARVRVPGAKRETDRERGSQVAI